MMSKEKVDNLAIGLELNGVNDLYTAVSHVTQSGYRFLITPIAHPRFHRDFISKSSKRQTTPFTRPDLVFAANDWSSLMVLKLSPWINVDSPNLVIRRNSEKALLQEINYGQHLSAFMVISIHNGNNINLARHLSNHIQDKTASFWVHVPMKASQDKQKLFLASQNPSEPFDIDYTEDTWEWWNTIRTIANNKQIGLCLEISEDISDQEVDRWCGENIAVIMLPTSIFLTNKKGFPVLSKCHQHLLKRFFKLNNNIRVVIRGINRHEHIKLYHLYVEHLFKTQEPPDFLSNYSRGYEDVLQIPLQPLMDNLETYTYETFEKDAIKYKEYERAIGLALSDMISEDEKEDKTAVVMVVGAGRGPLVRATLTASSNVQRKVRVYAVEKNPNAIVTLLALKNETWFDQVTVVNSDMREWDAPEKADILVSELLGSFGDNELSPECLEGAERLLKDDGISIPSTYTNYLAPISSITLHNACGSSSMASAEDGKISLKSYEMPYVVRLHNRTELGDPLPVFTFHHPNKDKPVDNTRYIKLNFKMPYNAMLHGFSGFFDSVLYKDVTLSIHPSTHTDTLFSWFPVFFPLREPIYVHADDDVELHFWRCMSTKDVWYEWLVSKPVITQIHNPNGRSYKIGK